MPAFTIVAWKGPKRKRLQAFFLDFYRITRVNSGIYRQNLGFTNFRAFTVTYILKNERLLFNKVHFFSKFRAFSN